MWKAYLMDPENGFSDSESIGRVECYCNGALVRDGDREIGDNDDVKQIFYHRTRDCARVVSLADGNVFTLPTADFTPDFRLSAQRSRYTADSFILNVSREDKSPYGNTEKGWNIYLSEWLNRYIADDGFLSCNRISRTRSPIISDRILPGFTVMQYDLVLEDAREISFPYYHIAIVRRNNEFSRFTLLMMKSAVNAEKMMDGIVRSFGEIDAVGTAKNISVTLPCSVPDYWNGETLKYYHKLCAQNRVDWGFFSASMVDEQDTLEFERQAKRIESEYTRLSTAIGTSYDIMPTYTHISWDERQNAFPLKMANRYAGGNGFNGKPVLQFTYQFTTHNNTDLHRYTPMFDILRGVYDEQFRRLGRDIRSYGKPVLFRLNNEMNTDWTSYCGLVTLLDPDIFIQTWERLYRIFREEGVDNTLWIFNPIATSTPYSRWGEYLCYLPSPQTVQMLGLTAYEMGNGERLRSFEDLYRELYAKNSPYFDRYPWIISEFGAGAGGARLYDYERRKYLVTEQGRNAPAQAQWIREMFDCFANRDRDGFAFCRNIKAAVWFNCNDYGYDNGQSYVTNYFNLDDGVPQSLQAFRDGLARTFV